MFESTFELQTAHFYDGWDSAINCVTNLGIELSTEITHQLVNMVDTECQGFVDTPSDSEDSWGEENGYKLEGECFAAGFDTAIESILNLGVELSADIQEQLADAFDAEMFGHIGDMVHGDDYPAGEVEEDDDSPQDDNYF